MEENLSMIMALLAAGRVVEASLLARELLSTDAGNAALLNVAAICAARLDQPDQAEHHWRQALILAPELADIHNNLGVLLDAQQRPVEAEPCFRAALRLRPDYPEAHLNLGNLLKGRKAFAAAEEAYRQALHLRPDLVEAHNNLGSLLHALGRLDEAEAVFQVALTLAPTSAEAHNNYGNLLDLTRRHDEAEAAFWQALRLQPEQVVGYLNLGNLFAKRQRHAEAITVFLEALHRRRQDADALFFLSISLLALGRYAEGWPLYESRFDIGKKDPVLLLPRLPFPRWQGENLSGKSLLVLHEQGYGDEIQFCRFMPILKELGVRSLTLVCKAPLKGLFAQGLGVDHLHAHDAIQIEDLPAHDAWTLLLSIPLHLRITLDNLPASLPYLHPLPERMALWAPRLPTTGLRVGLVWRGSSGHVNNAQRSLPGVAILAPLWTVTGVSFIGLQKAATEQAGDSPSPGQPLVDLGSEVVDFADTAAIIAQLDLVIGVDTAVVHLAGALGKPCWVLLPGIGVDWRWLQHRSDSPWYPGVMRLFRQEEREGWPAVIKRVGDALRAWVSEQGSTVRAARSHQVHA
ncbi:MAG: tetratricopeptide repeat protein [Magnetococcales bacterium]|nr:tetratricopeptide repeat protein [Magnetococcales bacterium]